MTKQIKKKDEAAKAKSKSKSVSGKKDNRDFHDFKIRPLIGGPQLSLKFAFDKNAKAILAVNIASKWKYTDRDLDQLVKIDK